MLIRSYSPAGRKFISRLQACLFLFTMWCGSPWPWGRLCWKNWCCVKLAQSSAADPSTSPSCRWLCSVFGCALILVALREPFSAVWVHPSLHCSFSPLLPVEANSLAPSNCCCHWASAVVVFRICNVKSPISFLAWCDVPLGQQHWPFTLHGFMSENPFLKVLPLAFVEGETL